MTLSRPLTKDESNLIKGVAILMIIFHNYFHIIPPAPGENQFSFDALHFERFKQLLLADPYSIVRYSFSYFGHYGVQLFVFISGYGLCVSNRNKEIAYAHFMRERIKKLYPTLFVIVVFLLLIIPLWEGEINGTVIKSLLLKLTLLFNFIPGEALAVTGPFWFFSVIVQLYLLFPFLLKLNRKYGAEFMLIIAAISWLLTILFNDFFYSLDVSLYVLFIGQLPVFCLGIYFASTSNIHLPPLLIVAALFIFYFGNEITFFWYFSQVAFSIFMMAFFLFFFPVIAKVNWLNSFLLFTGSISLYLFAVHGLARFPFEYLSEKYENDLITSALSGVYLGGVYLLARMVGRFDQKVQTKLSFTK